MENLDNYFNLIDYTPEEIEIVKNNGFDCILKNKSGKNFKGFLLATSENGNSHTICDISFHKSDFDKKYKTRLTFRRTNEKLQDKKVRADKIYQRITFEKGGDGYNEFWKMINFLKGFNDLIDLGEFEDIYSAVSVNDFIVSFKDKETAEKITDINNIIDESKLSLLDIENLSKNILYEKRKESLGIFEKLLGLNKNDDGKVVKNKEDENGRNFINQYKSENSLKQDGEEVAWHHFLKNNPWIIGLNVDLKFIEDFVDEADVGITDITGKGSPKVDIVGYSDYTVLIELKTANKNIFTKTKKSTARTNTWSFTDDFIDGISQCLAQKSEHDKERKYIKKENEDGKKETLKEIRTVDTDCIFIIGNKEREFPLRSALDEDDIKKDTFKRFRENSKNIKIITFDELYKRAVNILTDN